MTWRERLETCVDFIGPKQPVFEIPEHLNGLAEVLEAAESAIERLLKFNKELCEDVGVSTHYPSADFGREALIALREWRDGISNGKGENE